jgi:hypothetical protein
MQQISNSPSSPVNFTSRLDVDDFTTNTFLTNRRLWVLQTYIGNIDDFEKAIRCAIQRRLDVKIAVLSPKSVQLKFRAKELQILESEIEKHIWKTLNKLEVLSKENGFPDDYEVKIYDGTPTLGLYLLDNTLNLGIYWRNLNSTKGPNMVFNIDAQNIFSEQALMHFNHIWSNAQSINFRNPDWRNSV